MIYACVRILYVVTYVRWKMRAESVDYHNPIVTQTLLLIYTHNNGVVVLLYVDRSYEKDYRQYQI